MSPHNTFESRAGAGAHREGARGLLGVLGARQSQRVLGAHSEPVGCQLREGAHTTSESGQWHGRCSEAEPLKHVGF